MHRTRSASAPVDDLFSMSSSPAKLLGKGGSGSGRSGMTVLEEEGDDDDDDEGDSINRSFRHSFPVEPSSSLVGPPPGPPGLPGPPGPPPGPPGRGGLLPMSPGGSRPTLRRQIGLRRHGNNHVDTAKQFQKPSLNAIRGGFRRVFAKKKRKEAEAKGGGNHFTIALSSVPRSPEGIPVVLLELRRLILCNDGLDVEGIFRVAPDKAELNQAKEVLDATGTLSSPDSGADTDKCDVHIAATLIKVREGRAKEKCHAMWDCGMHDRGKKEIIHPPRQNVLRDRRDAKPQLYLALSKTFPSDPSDRSGPSDPSTRAPPSSVATCSDLSAGAADASLGCHGSKGHRECGRGERRGDGGPVEQGAGTSGAGAPVVARLYGRGRGERVEEQDECEERGHRRRAEPQRRVPERAGERAGMDAHRNSVHAACARMPDRDQEARAHASQPLIYGCTRSIDYWEET